MKCLTKINDTCWVLDHRLNPMVSAMFCAMASRLPTGGIEARYLEVVEAVGRDLRDGEEAFIANVSAL